MNEAIDPEQAWSFAQAEFQRREAELLRAQEEDGLDVVLHLFAAYARQCHGVELDGAALEEAGALTAEWRSEVILPLRAIRRRMKAKPAPGAGAEQAGAHARRKVLAAELQAERAQLDALCVWLAGRR